MGTVPGSFPVPALPALSGSALFSLLPTVTSVVFVGFIESIAVAKLYAQKHSYEVSVSTELKALGATNIAGALLFQAFPVMGAFGRSSVNEASGAVSPVSGLVSAATVALLLAFVMPALAYLPKPALAAIIISAVSSLIDSKAALALWRSDKKDALIMGASCLATLFMGVMPGVIASIALSLVVFLGLTTQPKVEELGRLEGTVIYKHLGMLGVQRVGGCKILRFLAPLFFANAPVLKDRVLAELSEREDLPPRLQWQALILCFASVSLIDSTAMQLLQECAAECRSRRTLLLLASANVYVEEALTVSGTLALLSANTALPRSQQQQQLQLLQCCRC